jgi:lipopolysaccharide kinase (Kdo/WaaP) family protein
MLSSPSLGQMEVLGTHHRLELRDATIVALPGSIEAIRTALRSGTLYEYASQHEEARSLAGRGIAYATPLPNGERVVVRHNRHGGLLAPLTGDRFLTPTRAPRELAVSLRLARSGVRTPEIVAYVVYRAGPLLRRSDVASREIRDAADLGAILTRDDAVQRRAALDATALLIGSLSACGARHHDLNVKNVLLARTPEGPPASLTAYVLDVDRVEFGRPGDSRITERNVQRFMRSARKWRELHEARIDESELARVAAAVRRVVSSRPSGEWRAITR